MPPRHAYWTIIIDNLPTAFRAARAEELLPTFERLRRKHPSAVMRWFARGRLWETPDAARQPQRQRSDRSKDWRPGGLHRDPRDRDRRPSRWRAVREQRAERRFGSGARRHPGQPGGRSKDLNTASRAGRPRAHKPGPAAPRPGDDLPGQPQPPPPKPPPGPDRPPRPGAEPDPVPSRTEEIVIPPEPPERGRRRSPRPRRIR